MYACECDKDCEIDKFLENSIWVKIIINDLVFTCDKFTCDEM